MRHKQFLMFPIHRLTCVECNREIAASKRSTEIRKARREHENDIHNNHKRNVDLSRYKKTDDYKNPDFWY